MNSVDQRPTICLCMIVKDEVDVLPACFDSCRELVECWLICDTGSSDDRRQLLGGRRVHAVDDRWPARLRDPGHARHDGHDEHAGRPPSSRRAKTARRP